MRNKRARPINEKGQMQCGDDECKRKGEWLDIREFYMLKDNRNGSKRPQWACMDCMRRRARDRYDRLKSKATQTRPAEKSRERVDV